MNDIENKMLVDGYWPDYEDDEEEEDAWEAFCRMADEAYDYDDGGVRSYRA